MLRHVLALQIFTQKAEAILSLSGNPFCFPNPVADISYESCCLFFEKKLKTTFEKRKTTKFVA